MCLLAIDCIHNLANSRLQALLLLQSRQPSSTNKVLFLFQLFPSSLSLLANLTWLYHIWRKKYSLFAKSIEFEMHIFDTTHLADTRKQGKECPKILFLFYHVHVQPSSTSVVEQHNLLYLPGGYKNKYLGLFE